MPVSAIRRPRYTARTVVQLVQQIANEISAENGGKVPEIFSIDARLRERFLATPEMINIDQLARDCRKHWERANNRVISARPGSNLYVPGAYVTLGRSRRGRMDSLDPIVEVNLWRLQDEEIRQNFISTMERRRAYQTQVIAEATLHPDCKTLGELEAKLRGYVHSAADADPFDGHADEEFESEE